MDLLPANGSMVGNGSLFAQWTQAAGAAGLTATAEEFTTLREDLVARGLVVKGAGRGGSSGRAAGAAAGSDNFALQGETPTPVDAADAAARPKATPPKTQKLRAADADEPAQVLSYRHNDRRKNNPEVGLVSEASDPQQPKQTWAYNPHLDPVLNFDSARAELETLKTGLKYRALFTDKELGAEGTSQYVWARDRDTGKCSRMGSTDREAAARGDLSIDVYAADNLTSQRPPGDFPVPHQGREFRPRKGYWKSHEPGFRRLGLAGRFEPHGAVEMLTHFKDVNAPALHSFVHGGIHAIQRGLTGYPVELLANVVRSSNGLYTMAGMLLAILSGDEALAKRMSKTQPRFADCLPPLIAPVAKAET